MERIHLRCRWRSRPSCHYCRPHLRILLCHRLHPRHHLRRRRLLQHSKHPGDVRTGREGAAPRRAAVSSCCLPCRPVSSSDRTVGTSRRCMFALRCLGWQLQPQSVSALLSSYICATRVEIRVLCKRDHPNGKRIKLWVAALQNERRQGLDLTLSWQVVALTNLVHSHIAQK
jgi:hypothetical protein